MTSVKLIEINEMAEGVAAARGVTPGSTALMDCFWGLASVSEASRVASAASLIRYVASKFAQLFERHFRIMLSTSHGLLVPRGKRRMPTVHWVIPGRPGFALD